MHIAWEIFHDQQKQQRTGSAPSGVSASSGGDKASLLPTTSSHSDLSSSKSSSGLPGSTPSTGLPGSTPSTPGSVGLRPPVGAQHPLPPGAAPHPLLGAAGPRSADLAAAALLAGRPSKLSKKLYYNHDGFIVCYFKTS